MLSLSKGELLQSRLDRPWRELNCSLDFLTDECQVTLSLQVSRPGGGAVSGARLFQEACVLGTKGLVLSTGLSLKSCFTLAALFPQNASLGLHMLSSLTVKCIKPTLSSEWETSSECLG